MRETMGKTEFDAIPIPPELEKSVKRGLRRGQWRLGLRRTLSGVAAVVALTFLAANIPPLYARAAELPLLAPLVRVMRVGNGGQAASGATAQIHSGQDRVWLTFTNEEEAAPVPAFSAVQRRVPRRVILRLHGLAQGRPLALVEALLRQSAVADAYALSATDPEEQGVVVHLQPGWSCAVGQYEQSLELQFTRSETAELLNAYVLCSQPLSPGMELAELTERLLWEGATQLRAPSGAYYVVLGEFSSKDRAETARRHLLEARNADLQVVPVVDGALQLP